MDNEIKTITEANKALRVGIAAVERVKVLESGLEEIKSQLLDRGFIEDSIIIISINELKNK